MPEKEFYLFDKEFDDKMKWLKGKLVLLMNGEASHQMSMRNSEYKVNYGVSLSHLKELSGNCNFTTDDLERMWFMNIRETMLLAALLLPQEDVTAERMYRWILAIKTVDMVEQSSFFLLSRSLQPSVLVSSLLNSNSSYALPLACYTAGRIIQKGGALSADVINEVFDAIKNQELSSSCEARGCSLFLRMILRHKLLPDSEIAAFEESLGNAASELSTLVFNDLADERDMAIL